MKIPVSLIAALALLIAVDASSAVYMWEDNAGVVSFTEDLGNIPLKYRKKAKIVGQEQSDDPEYSNPVELQNNKSLQNAPEAVNNKVKSPPVDDAKVKMFGGKNESYWFNEFGKVKSDLRSYKVQLEAINSRLSMSDSISRSEYLSLYNTRKLLEEQEGTARKKLETLTVEADKANVPMDIR